MGKDNKKKKKSPVVPIQSNEYELGDTETFIKRRKILSGGKFSTGGMMGGGKKGYKLGQV